MYPQHHREQEAYPPDPLLCSPVIHLPEYGWLRLLQYRARSHVHWVILLFLISALLLSLRYSKVNNVLSGYYGLSRGFHWCFKEDIDGGRLQQHRTDWLVDALSSSSFTLLLSPLKRRWYHFILRSVVWLLKRVSLVRNIIYSSTTRQFNNEGIVLSSRSTLCKNTLCTARSCYCHNNRGQLSKRTKITLTL